MIHTVTFEKTTYAEVPARFEAGTPDIAGVIGLGTAVDYLSGIGMSRIEAWEQELLVYGTERLLEIPQVRIIGTSPNKAAPDIVKWSGAALLHRVAWTGENYNDRVYTLYKLRAAASHTTWMQAQTKLDETNDPDDADYVDRKRTQTKRFAKEWYGFAKKTSKPHKSARELCVVASGSTTWCDGA